MSSVLFLFLNHLGLGLAGTLLLVKQTAGVKFFRFNAGVATILLLSALAFRPETLGIGGRFESLGLVALTVATGTLLIYWATVGRVLFQIRTLLLWITLVAGSISLVYQGFSLSALEMGPSPTLTILSFFSSTALLGGSCVAMILGHWYLVLPSMEVSLLQSIVKFHIVTTFFRIIVVITIILIALSSWESPSGAEYSRYALSIEGVFLWQRLLFGLVSPLVLSFLIWETAKIRSTQSATGILYVDFFTVIVGEVLAKYLLLTTLVPV
jgi:protein NrfD